MAVVLDSDAVIGFLDRSDPHHYAADAAIRSIPPNVRLVVSVITFAEVLTEAKLGHRGEAAISGFFAEIISEIVPVGPETADRAATLRANNETLRLPDALIAATADLHPDVDTLLTGDRNLARLNQLDCDISTPRNRLTPHEPPQRPGKEGRGSCQRVSLADLRTGFGPNSQVTNSSTIVDHPTM